MKKVTSLLMALILSVTILMGSIPMNASAATTEVPVGWYQQGKKVYYYENGKKVTGWHTLKSYYDKKKYKFYFNKNGVLVTDLFTLNYKKWIKKDITIVVNTKTHNATLYAKDKKTGKYNIPLKTMVCSTSRKAKGTKAYSGCRLEKTSAVRWFIYKKKPSISLLPVGC